MSNSISTRFELFERIVEYCSRRSGHHAGDVFHDERLRANLTNDTNELIDQSISRVLDIALAHRAETLARRTSENEIDFPGPAEGFVNRFLREVCNRGRGSSRMESFVRASPRDSRPDRLLTQCRILLVRSQPTCRLPRRRDRLQLADSAFCVYLSFATPCFRPRRQRSTSEQEPHLGRRGKQIVRPCTTKPMCNSRDRPSGAKSAKNR